MIKSLGLGVCCLALGFAGVTRASTLPVDGNKGDCVVKDHSCDKDHVDFKCDKHIDLDHICCDSKAIKALVADIKCDEKDLSSDKKDLKCDVKELKCDIKDHAPCWEIDKLVKDIKSDRCDIKSDEHDLCQDFCQLRTDLRDHHCCDPAGVPAPASAAFGGLGVVGVMLLAGLRSRRSEIC